MTKLYREYRGSGTILWDMIKDEKTTLRDMQGHFHRAIQSAEGSPKIVQRLADHWMEMQQHFDSVELMRSYYSRFLIMRAGRGLPKLVDEHIVMLVMVDELGRVRRGAGGAGAAESAAVMEKAMSSIESFKSTVTDLKSKVSDLKQEVNNLKNEVSNIKKEKPRQGEDGAERSRVQLLWHAWPHGGVLPQADRRRGRQGCQEGGRPMRALSAPSPRTTRGSR